MVMDILFDNESMYRRFGVMLAERPVIPVAEPIYDEYVVPGRNTVLKEFNRYENTEFTLRFNYIDKHAKHRFIELVNWLQGREIYQESGSKYHRVLAQSITGITDANNDMPEWVDFEMNIETEPFWYEDAGTETITSDVIIENPSVIEAPVVIRVYGTGVCRLRINGELIEVTDVQGHVTLDGILKMAHRNMAPQDNNMSGKYPVLKSGKNEISIEGSTDYIEVDVRWCWR